MYLIDTEYFVTGANLLGRRLRLYMPKTMKVILKKMLFQVSFLKYQEEGPILSSTAMNSPSCHVWIQSFTPPGERSVFS